MQAVTRVDRADTDSGAADVCGSSTLLAGGELHTRRFVRQPRPPDSSIPRMESPVQSFLDMLLADVAADRSGAVADYIPELAAADPDRLGISLATIDGAVYTAGDGEDRFTIQSMSKPFTYALALGDRGLDLVDAHIGVEPTGDTFNSISLESGTGRPRNPMINAGAIIATSLVAGDRDKRILSMYSRCAGRSLNVDRAVFESERDTGHRNRAIGHMLRAVEILHEEPGPVLDAYFRQCAISVDCRDVAVMAATLANSGVNPLTQERVIDAANVRRVLSVMTTCGMYDGAGGWLVGVGLPAKSGVAGGVMAVVPGQLGVCVFSPRLDEHGNSVRGVTACRRVSRELGLHLVDVGRAALSTVRAQYDLARMPSTRRRPPAERETLAQLGRRCTIYELQGDLVFGGMERVMRDIVQAGSAVDLVLLDLSRTHGVDAAARRSLARLGADLAARRRTLVLVAPPSGDVLPGARTFGTLDGALEWCEWELLGLDRDAERAAVALDAHSLTRGLSDAHRVELRELLTSRRFEAGDMLVTAGDKADEVFLLMAGEVAVLANDVRLATLLPGAVFGETSLLTDGAAARTADVVAEGSGELFVLTRSQFDALGDTNPALQASLLRELLHACNEVVVRLTRQVAALS